VALRIDAKITGIIRDYNIMPRYTGEKTNGLK